MVDDGSRCAVCGAQSFVEPAQHSIDCPRHEPETCTWCSEFNDTRSLRLPPLRLPPLRLPPLDLSELRAALLAQANAPRRG
jgi:hypothetical protein